LPVTDNYVPKTVEERFWSNVGRPLPTGCWPWAARTNEHGYGTFWNGEKRRGHNVKVLAHRWSFEHFVGPIPEGLCVLHKCDEPGCVAPEHLFLGTQADNVADCVAKGRRNQSHFWKLTPAQYLEIRALYETGEYTYAALGRKFGVTYQHIRSIVIGKSVVRKRR